MGAISDQHVEWALVNRLKSMLEQPPDTPFNVTQSFAIFSAVLMWAKQRAWVGGVGARQSHRMSAADQAAHSVRQQLRSEDVFGEPWRLPRQQPQFLLGHGGRPQSINDDFENMNAEAFFKWLRDALAHGDGRTISPIHKPSRQRDREFLAGFKFDFKEHRTSQRRLVCSLYDGDMRRMGAELADRFCRALSGLDEYAQYDVATASIVERAA